MSAVEGQIVRIRAVVLPYLRSHARRPGVSPDGIAGEALLRELASSFRMRSGQVSAHRLLGKFFRFP